MSLIRYKENPFLKQLSQSLVIKKKRIQVTPMGGNNNVLLNQETGEVLGTHVTAVRPVDNASFVKLFVKNIALTFDLSSAGIKAFNVLLWAIQNTALSKDIVALDGEALDDFLNEHKDQNLKLSKATYKRGLNELEKAQIIAKSTRAGFYWLNPNFVFNGDRIAFTTVIKRVEQGYDKRYLEEPEDFLLVSDSAKPEEYIVGVPDEDNT